ncbi:MAG: ImmA/IrrE family metallo-endopeptidase [Actinomycetota bacterium]|nr:ImmA/IrrE family metallo-endopeptidase [Actinomycetota bacterium]
MTVPFSPHSGQAAGLAAALEASGLDRSFLSGLPLPPGVALDDVLSGEVLLGMDGLIAASLLTDTPISVLTGRAPASSSLSMSLRLGQFETAHDLEGTVENAAMVLAHRALVVRWLGEPQRPLQGFAPSRDRFALAAGRISAQRVRDVLAYRDIDPFGDVVELLEAEGHPVMHREMPDGVHGLALRKSDADGAATAWAVYVAVSVPWTRQRWTLAHELSHVLHDDIGQMVVETETESEALPEVRAEAFARHLLLPPEALAAALPQRPAREGWRAVVGRLVVLFGVSRKAIVKALVADGHATDEELTPVSQALVRDLIEAAGAQEEWDALAARQHEPQGSPWLVGSTAELYATGLVDVRVVADLMDLEPDDARTRLHATGWAPEAPAAG